LKRRVIVFKSEANARRVLADAKGWGNERKVVWKVTPSTRVRIIDEDYEAAYPEGTRSYAIHTKLERCPKVARAAKRRRLKDTGKLECEVCSFDFALEYGAMGEGFIEAHHRVPVSQLDGKKKTTIADLALVCSNCHRMLHRGKKLLSTDQLRSVRDGEV